MSATSIAERPSAAVPTRDQVALEDTWDLSTIYADDAGWEADAARMPALIAAATSHQGKLGDSPGDLRRALDDLMSLRRTLERLRIYANLRRDEDTSNTSAQARYEQSIAIAIEASQALAYVEPELLSLSPERFDELRTDPQVETYRHLLDDLARRRAHVRSFEVEQVLAQGADIARAPSDGFTALDNADLTFGRVRDESGNVIELTKARHALLLRSTDRPTRQRSYEAFTKAYLDHRYTLSALHSASVRSDVFYARVRNYPSAREAALFDNNVPLAVYDNLITEIRRVNRSLPAISSYDAGFSVLIRLLPTTCKCPCLRFYNAATPTGRPSTSCSEACNASVTSTSPISAAASISAGSTSTKPGASARGPTPPGPTACPRSS